MLDKEKVDEYYIDLYKKLMYTENDLENLKRTKEKTDEIADNLDLFINKVHETLEFLKNNKESWYIEGEDIYIENNEIADKYNNLVSELNKIIKEKFIITKYDISNNI